ncbi:MAG: lysine--tRNA ligase [Planctomycetota bacterium]|nr:MAG: lysine--tRNA ligase [Planctomycetota bacterium]
MSELFHPDRLQRLNDLRQAGVDPYPPRSPENREWAQPLVEAADARSGETVTICGRILGRRGYGKLAFLDLHDQSGKIQACAQKNKLPEAEFALLKKINLGDFVAIRGELGRTKMGEATVFAESLQLLSKSLAEPPEKWHGLSDVELRARMRYVDLFSNAEIRQRFQRRSAVLAAMRRVMEAEGYLEVDTPVLHPIYGGANARPFRTHHNTLDMPLYLRIAPELYLKRLLVGGLERVYEFARVFRNEGISVRHNPEFTMLEFYGAYGDYRSMAALTESLVVAAAEAAGCRQEDGSLSTEFRGSSYDLTPPFPKLKYRELFVEHAGFEPEDRDRVANRCRELSLEVELDSEYGYWKAVNRLFEEEVESKLTGPVFVMDYPAAISPLAKPCPEHPGWAERFEFFLGGMELANAFSELNDPHLQMENFQRQVQDKDPEMPNEVDWDYVRALAYGLPPAGGCGIGIDRLVMVLLGVDNIREVLLFPLLRPEVGMVEEDSATDSAEAASAP